MVLIRTLTISTTKFERMKEKFYGFRQTEVTKRACYTLQATILQRLPTPLLHKL